MPLALEVLTLVRSYECETEEGTNSAPSGERLREPPTVAAGAREGTEPASVHEQPGRAASDAASLHGSWTSGQRVRLSATRVFVRGQNYYVV